MNLTATPEATRSERLADITDHLHEQLHTLVAAAAPFSSRERYVCWLNVQYRFQARIIPLYEWVSSEERFELSQCGRLDRVEQDLADLGQPLPELKPSATDFSGGTLSQALGWLFVSEGSTLGAAVLLKRASRLGMTENFGARHLAPAPEGRGQHWRAFVSALNEQTLSDAEEAQLQEAASAAFRYFGELLEEAFELSGVASEAI